MVYAILDLAFIARCKRNIYHIARSLAKAGVDIFQFRFPEETDAKISVIAQRLSKIVHAHGKLFIVNNRADIALLSRADGVHLGKNDITPKLVRKIVGKNMIIGKSAHSIREVKLANDKHVDYVSAGAVFKSTTKPCVKTIGAKKLARMHALSRKPFFAIGGITPKNVHKITKAYVHNCAIARELVLAKNKRKTVRFFKTCLSRTS